MPDWFQATEAPGGWRGLRMLTEPLVSDMYRANLYTVFGRDADLQFDFGCGVVPLAPALGLGAKPVIAVASHAHVDHIGGFHEFSDRRGHGAEAEGFATMAQPFTLAAGFAGHKYGPTLLAPPHPGHDFATWALTPAPLTSVLAEGDRIDLGDLCFTVLHLPGHSPGGIGLLEERSGLFLTGDAIYDDRLLDDLPGSSVPDYLATMARLAELDCALALGGHGAPMSRTRLHKIARDYIARNG